jgi:hypothetical protein
MCTGTTLYAFESEAISFSWAAHYYVCQTSVSQAWFIIIGLAWHFFYLLLGIFLDELFDLLLSRDGLTWFSDFTSQTHHLRSGLFQTDGELMLLLLLFGSCCSCCSCSTSCCNCFALFSFYFLAVILPCASLMRASKYERLVKSLSQECNDRVTRWGGWVMVRIFYDMHKARLTINLDRLIVLSESSLLGWFLQVSLI